MDLMKGVAQRAFAYRRDPAKIGDVQRLADASKNDGLDAIDDLTIACGLACEHLWASGHCPYEKGVEMHIAVLGNAGAANGATKLAFGAIFDWPLGQYAGRPLQPTGGGRPSPKRQKTHSSLIR